MRLKVFDYMQGESRLTMIPFWFVYWRSMYWMCNQSTAK